MMKLKKKISILKKLALTGLTHQTLDPNYKIEITS